MSEHESIGERIAREYLPDGTRPTLAAAINEAIDRERQRAENADLIACSDIDREKSRADDLENELDTLHQRAEKAERELADVREHLRDTQQRNGGNIAKLERAEAGLRRLQRLRQTAERERSNLEADIVKLRDALDRAPATYEDEIIDEMIAHEELRAEPPDDDEKCPMCDATDPAERRDLPRPGGTTSPCMNEWHDPRTLEEWRAEALASRQVVRLYMRACNDMANSRETWRCMEIPLQRALDELGPHDSQQPINVTMTWTWTTGVDTVHSMLAAIRARETG